MIFLVKNVDFQWRLCAKTVVEKKKIAKEMMKSMHLGGIYSLLIKEIHTRIFNALFLRLWNTARAEDAPPQKTEGGEVC